MRLVVEYNPTAEEMRKQLLKAFVQGERLKWSAVADSEIARKKPILEQKIAKAIHDKTPLDLNMAEFITGTALEAIESGEDADSDQE